jgi:serine/threonine-protein kinase
MTPDKIGRYEIKAELGRGGMATVFQAHDPRFGRDVAIKVLPPEFLHDPTFRARFEREAQTIAALEHPAIVPVYDYGEDNEQPFLVMRYLSGGSLGERLKQGPLPFTEAVRIVNRVAPALDEAHNQGIIHRDLKPDNILFDHRQDPFIADFGIVKLSSPESGALTASNVVVGTPAYMSPEQINGEELDGRSDIYSLGVILFQMLVGSLPYDAPTPVGLLMKHLTEPTPPILEIKPDLPPDCAGVVDRAMAKERDKRYAVAAELADDLVAALRSQPSPKQENRTVVLKDTRERISTEQKKAIQAKQTEKLNSLLHDLTTQELQPDLLQQLLEIGDQAAAALANVLATDNDPYTRYNAARALSELCAQLEIKPPLRGRMVQTLIKALADPEPSIRFWAAAALGSVQGEAGRMTLQSLTRLLADPDENVRLQAEDSIQKINEGLLPEAGSSEVMICLKIIESQRDVEFILDRAIYLGRAALNHHFQPEVDLTDDGGFERGVSRRHARIIKEEGTVLAEDLDSANGTFINNKQLTPHQPEILRHNDHLRLGSLVIKVEIY